MWTKLYKGFYIHGYGDRSECSVKGRTYRSLHAAKCAITRVLAPEHDAQMCELAARFAEQDRQGSKS